MHSLAGLSHAYWEFLKCPAAPAQGTEGAGSRRVCSLSLLALGWWNSHPPMWTQVNSCAVTSHRHLLCSHHPKLMRMSTLPKIPWALIWPCCPLRLWHGVSHSSSLACGFPKEKQRALGRLISKFPSTIVFKISLYLMGILSLPVQWVYEPGSGKDPKFKEK